MSWAIAPEKGRNRVSRRPSQRDLEGGPWSTRLHLTAWLSVSKGIEAVAPAKRIAQLSVVVKRGMQETLYLVVGQSIAVMAVRRALSSQRSTNGDESNKSDGSPDSGLVRCS
jgi:hypothetical protein